MTTALAVSHPKIRQYAQSLTQQERFRHRAWIGVRVDALFDPYWQNRPSEAVRDLILQDWMAALENFDPEEIGAACRAYLSGGNCRAKPKPGDIIGLINKERAKLLAALPKPEPAPEPDRGSAEDRREYAARVLSEVFAKSPLGGDA